MMFSVTNGDLELRSCNAHLILNGEHTTADIVRWEGEAEKRSCYSIAYWILGKEGYDLRFVGERPFDRDIDPAAFMSFAKTGQDLLDIMFRDMKAKEY
jgi:hypothetical protein